MTLLAHIANDAAALIQLLATAVIVFYVSRAGMALVRGRGIDAARLLLTDGVLAALGFSLAATLLKVILLNDWTQIRAFTVVLVLRTLLKRVFTQEHTRIAYRSAVATPVSRRWTNA